MITDWIFEFAVWLRQTFCHHEYKELYDYHLEIIFYQCQKCGRKRINEPPKPLIKQEKKDERILTEQLKELARNDCKRN